MYILAGANGSGKSTISRVLLPEENVTYINPDDIAKELNPARPVAAAIAAGKEALRRVDEYIAEGRSFAIESTLSGFAYVKRIERARSLGYEVYIGYVYLDSPEMCIARIAARVKAGGHYIPDDDVRRRYARSKANFLEVYAKIADHWMLYNNEGFAATLIAHGNGAVNVIDGERYEAFKEGLCRK